MKQTSNMTLSLPNDIIHLLHKHLPKGQISKFTAEALKKALDDRLKQKEEELKAAYQAACQDTERELQAKEWSSADNDIVGWEWYDK